MRQTGYRGRVDVNQYEFYIPIRALSKKNSLIPFQGGKRIPEDLQAELDAMQLIVQSQWSGRRPLTNAEVHMRFQVADRRSDLDNAYQTVSDCLVKSGVLANDSMAHVVKQSSDFVLVGVDDVGVVVRVKGDHIERP